MGQDVKFVVLTRNEPFAAEVRSQLLRIDGVKVVGELDEPALIAQAAQQFPVDVLLVDLDPYPDAVLPIVADVAAAHRGVAVFAASESTDGQLILRAMRTGTKEFLPKPIDFSALKEAVERVAAGRVETTTQGHLITIMGTSGGVGATLLATNLAVELASLVDGHVTVVDLDYRFGQVATLLDMEPKYSLADLCSSPEELDPQIVGRALNRHASGVQVLSRPNHLGDADVITAAACMGVFNTLMQMNDFVVADGPMRYDVGAQPVLALSDVTLLVVHPAVPCVRNALRIIENMRDSGFNLDRARLIVNRSGRGGGQLSVNDVTETLGLPLFASLPEDWEAASGSANLGEPLAAYGPKSRVRMAIQEIAQRLHSPQSPSDERVARKPGLISRIFAGN